MKKFRNDITRLVGYEPNFLTIARLLITDPGVLAIFLYRIQQKYTKNKGKNIIAKLIRVINHNITGADFCIGAQIDKGLIIRHPNGIVIGSGTIIGQNCTLLQQVTFGEKYGDGSDILHQYPKVGSNVTISAGAKLIGNVIVGDNVIIGANSVVLKNIPNNSVAVGVPAKVIKQNEEKKTIKVNHFI
ncbi:serine O-acetyltransferase [Heyndrickxia coagulans]|uniref:serine O-acetyltransferase n=1 Tax=Heyndrickxia coagulans TaxID=1398 RepID=UPI003D212593